MCLGRCNRWIFGALIVAGAGSLVWWSFFIWNLLSEPYWNDAQPDAALEQANHRTAVLTAKYQGTLQRRKAKQRIATELIAKRLTLRAAAAQFYEIDRTVIAPDLYLQQLEICYPGKTVQERLCRQVLEYVRLRAETDSRWRNALCGLEAELEEIQQGLGGKGLFPDPNPQKAEQRTRGSKFVNLRGQ